MKIQVLILSSHTTMGITADPLEMHTPSSGGCYSRQWVFTEGLLSGRGLDHIHILKMPSGSSVEGELGGGRTGGRKTS